MKDAAPRPLGLWAAVAIGVGGMVGGGIFAVLGLAVELAHGGTPVAFAVAGVVALLTAYSYARLSVRFPSQGGTVVFLDRAFGIDLVTGGLNNLLWLSYVVMLALYAYAFGSYAATFFSPAHRSAARHVLITAAILLPTLLNTLSADVVGRTETYVVVLKLAILCLFVAVGISRIHPAAIAPATWSPTVQLLAGGMMIFVAYEGFELIANSAEDVRRPGTTLPRAFYASVGFVMVLYVLIAVVALGSLPIDRIVAAKDYALAEAAKPLLGSAGFTLIAIAAMLSTMSAINATLYGAARLSYTIAKEGELPAFLEKKLWHKPIEGLLITAALALILANTGGLSSISTMGSSGFLLTFAAVNAANLRLHAETGSRRWLAAVGLLACLSALGALLWETSRHAPERLWVLAAMLAAAFGIELVYRRLGRRRGLSGKGERKGLAGTGRSGSRPPAG